MTAPLLEVENLKTHFFTRRGVVKAVDGVSFRVDKGETLGLVGESGCGKTITSLSLLRLVPQPGGKIVGGKILFEGEDLLQKSEADMHHIRGRKVAIILQDPMTSLNPVYSIGEQIAEAVRLHKGASGRTVWNHVIDALKRVNIPAAENRVGNYPHQMSGGMRQRVSGAIAISCDPSLIIADEPTTSLDVTIQAQYLRLLKQLQQQYGVGIIFITHDFGIVARVCDKVAVMYGGQIVESAETRELFNRPTHPYTVALLRSLPSMDKSVDRLMSIEGQPPSLLNPAPGCRFAPRCAAADARCAKDPEPVWIGEDHSVRCWRVK